MAHLRGLLADIEAKNRTAFGTSGAVDSSARIPWRHVGPGTRHNNWASERFARPGDPETVDMTFQPRISKESKKIMGGGEYGEGSGGANNFLDRLNNDLRKRQTNRKELERRYYSEGAGAGSPAQAEADWQVVAEGLQSRCHVALDRDDPAGTEELIDEAVDKLSTGESWREAGCRAGPIRAAKGPGKVAAMAQALRSLAFMERYKSDLKQKNGKMKVGQAGARLGVGGRVYCDAPYVMSPNPASKQRVTAGGRRAVALRQAGAASRLVKRAKRAVPLLSTLCLFPPLPSSIHSGRHWRPSGCTRRWALSTYLAPRTRRT